jgi:hypothetical protein
MKTAFTSVCLGLLLVALCAPVAVAEEDENEQKVQLKDCPEAVQKTIKRETEGGKILEIEKERHRGKVVYECEYIKDKHRWEITVAENGKLLKKEREDDDEDEDGDDDDDEDDDDEDDDDEDDDD